MNAKTRNEFRHCYCLARVAMNGARQSRHLGCAQLASEFVAKAKQHRATAATFVR